MNSSAHNLLEAVVDLLLLCSPCLFPVCTAAGTYYLLTQTHVSQPLSQQKYKMDVVRIDGTKTVVRSRHVYSES